jgi:exonuclease SbcD
VSVGGSDNVDAAVFAPFDYVALGHIHGPQRAADNARYCGSPLKYSFSEVAHQKSVTVAELPAKGALTLRTLPLTPLHDMAKLRGTYDELMDRRRYQQYNTADYLHITLTDEEDVPDAIGRLRAVYPRIMKLDYDNQRTRAANELTPMEQPEQRSPLAVLEELYEKQNGQPLSEEQRTFAEGLIEEIWGGCA